MNMLERAGSEGSSSSPYPVLVPADRQGNLEVTGATLRYDPDADRMVLVVITNDQTSAGEHPVSANFRPVPTHVSYGMLGISDGDLLAQEQEVSDIAPCLEEAELRSA